MAITGVVRNPEEKNKANVYCPYCDVVVRGKEIYTQINDAEQVEFYCPGCDNEILRPVDAMVYHGGLRDGDCRCGGWGCNACQ